MAEQDLNAAYSEETEHLKVVKTQTGSKFKIMKDQRTGFWTINVDSGTVPAPLRGRYTHYSNALVDIKNYVDGHSERQIEYKKLREKSAA